MQPVPSIRGRHGPIVVSPVPAAALPRQGQPAGVVSRLLANGLDFLVLLVFLGASYLSVCGFRLLLHPSSFNFPTVPRLALLVTAGSFCFVYLTACWWLAGRTYGDRVMALAVLNFRGERMKLAGAALRAVFCIGFPIGVLWCAVNRSSRSVQDIVLRTSVIYDWRD